jgi:hypothetical protein
MSSTVVTLSSSAEAPAVIRISRTMTRYGRPPAFFTARIATYSKTPVWRRTPTMIIIPSSRKMTSQSTPVSGSWNACSKSSTPAASMTAAPVSATVTRWTFSEAIST